MAQALEADAVLLGAVGGPKWDSLPFEKKPERGLLRLRKDMELFANLRPAIVFDALAEASTLKTELVRGLDIMIVRELTGGVYFGEPARHRDPARRQPPRRQHPGLYDRRDRARGPRRLRARAQARPQGLLGGEGQCHGERRALARGGAEAAATPNITDVALSHMYADNCAMQLVRQPKQFDVIVTDNLFGDLLSDCAAMLTGSLGMLPSASLGAADATRAPARALRAGPWLGAGHRRQGSRQSRWPRC